jgi:EmrB/QacA subfamily drug resistance transporter
MLRAAAAVDRRRGDGVEAGAHRPSAAPVRAAVPPPSPPHAATADLVAQRAAFRTVFPGVMVAMVLAALDQTILAAAIPAIAGALGNFADVSWLASAYLIAVTVTAPIYGHLGDRFGRRRMLYVALTLFVLASLACSLATSLSMLIVARTLQGMGGGGLMTLSQALISEQVPPRERGRYQGYFAGLFAVSSTLGPVLGGYLTQHASWRAVFLINIPLGIVAGILARRVPYTPGHRDGPFRPDVLGTVLFALGACTLLFTLSSGGHRIAWSSPLLLALVAVAVGAFALLYFWERRIDDPVIPVKLLSQAVILRSNIVVVTFGATLFALILYLPLFLQLSRSAGVGESGLLLLPVTLTSAMAALFTGRYITRTGRITMPPIFGLSVSTIALLALAAIVPTAPTWLVLCLIVVIASGLGTVMPACQIIVQDTAGARSLGSATASVSVSRSFGGALGSALAGMLLFLMLVGDGSAFASVLARVGDVGAASLDAMPAADRLALRHRVNDAFRVLFLILAGITAFGAAMAFSIPKRRL